MLLVDEENGERERNRGGGSVGGLVRGYELPGRAMGCMDGLIR